MFLNRLKKNVGTNEDCFAVLKNLQSFLTDRFERKYKTKNKLRIKTKLAQQNLQNYGVLKSIRHYSVI